MVKNTKGGSGHKKFARKFAGGAKNSQKLRVSQDEGELYCVVTKMLGNGMFHCFCIDGVTRLGHIRGKFSGRGKNSNLVAVNKWLLVGLREWDIVSDKSAVKMSSSAGKEKLQHCDLLEVYSDSDNARLKETVAEDWSILEANTTTVDTDATIVGFEFSSKDDNYERLMGEIESATAEKIVFKIGEGKDEGEGSEEEDVDINDL